MKSIDIRALRTKRLIIRTANMKDAPFLLELVNSPGWLKYIGDRNVKSLEAAKSYIRDRLIESYRVNGFGLMVVTDHTGIAIGLCGLLKRPYLKGPDLGFAVLPQYEGKGFMYESSQAIIQHCLTLKIEQIYATTMQGNKRSQQLLGKLGFKYIEDIQIGSSYEQLQLFALQTDLIQVP